MLVFHHKDNDGYCAAACANCYLVNGYDMPSDNDFIGYTHGETLDIESLRPIRPRERVYILDLAMDDTTFALVKYAIDNGATVVFIDHHKTTQEYIDNVISEEDKKNYLENKEFIFMYETALSACMLTFIYSSMNDDEQLKPMDVPFTNTDDWIEIIIGSDTSEWGRHYTIPLAVRYCDDYDVWRWFHEDTEAFNLGFTACEYRDKPSSKEWSNLLNKERGVVPGIVNAGYHIIGYRDAQYKLICKHGYEATINGQTCFAVNTSIGDSKLFGEKIDEYPMCVMYRYLGDLDLWKVEFRSGDNGIDVSEIAKSFGGGGHFHASGCQVKDINDIIKRDVTK